MIYEGSPSNLKILSDQIVLANSYGYNVTEIFLKSYIGLIIYLLLSIIAAFLIIKIYISNKNSEKLIRIISFYVFLAILFASVIFLYFFNLAFGPLRLLCYIIFVLFLFVGFLLFQWSKNESYQASKIKKNVFLVVTVLTVFSVSISGIILIYQSPYTLKTNDQVTLMEIKGMSWIFGHEEPRIKFLSITIPIDRYADLLLTSEDKIRYGITAEVAEVPLHHFGYNNCTNFGDAS